MSRQYSLMKRLSAPNASIRTEADIQSDIKLLLLSGAFELDELRLEEPMADGSQRRIDIAVGSTVIEVKKHLQDEASSRDYIEQLEGYVSTRVSQEQSRYNGILTDGREWWLYEIDPIVGNIVRRSTFTLSSPELDLGLVDWLQAVLSTNRNVLPTQETVMKYLGADSPAYSQDMAYLKSVYELCRDNSMVGLKRNLWSSLLRGALGTGFDDNTKLFIDHTLLVIEASIIGHAVMGLSLEDLAAHPEQLLDGEEFRQAGIFNVIEPGFFDWVLLGGVQGRRFLTRIIQRISSFEWEVVEHDVLKILYESIINSETRKSMGEYYTPDWLARGLIDNVIDEPLSQTVLDPACGSGTFLFQLIRKVVQAGEAQGWSSEKIVDHVQKHIYGMDMHPVSVILARVTYLLALGEKLEDRGDIWVPVHLGDSMQWYQPVEFEQDVLKVDTDNYNLTGPNHQEETLFDVGRTLAFPLHASNDTDDFDRLVNAMTERAKEHVDRNSRYPNIAPIFSRFGITPHDPDYAMLYSTFAHLCELNAAGEDSIWGFYVRNQSRPLWLSIPDRRVDVIVGNPPWLSYRFMTEEMQSKFSAFAKRLNLWTGGKVATQQDLVGLFIARCVSKYLRTGGTFGFVTPLAVLSRQAYEGFRSGKWGKNIRPEFTELWDLDSLRPNGYFPVPSSVVFGVKHTNEGRQESEDTVFQFPREKKVWEGEVISNETEGLFSSFECTISKNVEISTDDTPSSVYHSTVVNGATIFPKFLFFVSEEKKPGSRLGKSTGTVVVNSRRGRLDKSPWRDLPGLSGVVPSRYVFDVLIGASVVPFRILGSERAVLPISGDGLIGQDQIDSGDERLREWWNNASDIWEGHKSAKSKLSLWENLNYQNKLGKQFPAMKHRVLYTLSGNRLAAARTNNQRAIIDQTLLWMPVSGIPEGRFLTSVLNSSVTTDLVSSYQSRGLFGPRHFTKYVWRLPIPKFDPQNDAHLELVALAEEAEDIAEGLDVGGLGFKQVRGAVREELDALGISSSIDALVSSLIWI